MLLPYLLGIAIVYGSAVEGMNEWAEAKKQEYKVWHHKEGPVPFRQLLKAFAGSLLLGFCFHYEFSTHTAMLCGLCLTFLLEFISWKRLREYKKAGDLIVNSILLVVLCVFTVNNWDWFS